MTEQEVNNLIDSKIAKTKMSQLPEATQTSGLYSIGYNGNQSVKYKANLLQGDPLTVRKTYQTETEALADKNPIDPTTSLPLTVGQFVSIVDDGEKNGIYRIGSISGDGTMSLELQGKLGDLSGYTKTGGSTKTTKEVDDDLAQLAGDLEEFSSNFDNIFGIQDRGKGKYYRYVDNSSPVVLTSLSQLNYLKIPVLKGQIYEIKTRSTGVGHPFYVVDEDYNILQDSGKVSSYENIITINDSDAKYLIVNVLTSYIDSFLVERITNFTNNLDTKVDKNNSENIETEAVVLSSLAGILEKQTITLNEDKLIFNYNPIFRTAKGQWFKIFPEDSSVFEIPIIKNRVIVVNKSDIANIDSSSFTNPSYISFQSITSVSGKLDDYIILLEIDDQRKIYDKFSIGSFYMSNTIDNIQAYGVDSFFTDKAPSFTMNTTKIGQSVNISFSANPRIFINNGASIYLFPEDSENLTLPALSAYYIFYIEREKLLYRAWANTEYLSEGDIKTTSFLQIPNLKNNVILAINQTGELINYGAIGHKYYDDLTRQTPALKEDVLELQNSVIEYGVKGAFPTPPTYHNLLKEKCPKFYDAMFKKDKDVTVCLTGTSLSQGNLYATTRSDATERPPLLHTNDLSSHLFDKMFLLWGGQKYRRYDHSDLTYSESDWTVTNDYKVGETSIWDDELSDHNGVTKRTTDANASVSFIVPKDAWQFNFVYRTDSLGGNCLVNITQGNLKMEVFNGVDWVEANGFQFTMLEPPTTATKGNTIFQKRLKMRCRDKGVDGINSIGTVKNMTISKGADSSNFNVVGIEWSPREFMFTFINAARGSHQWGPSGNFSLQKYQDGDIWEFNPDLILTEVTTINWGASGGISTDPLQYVNNAKRAFFNVFDDNPNSLYEKSNKYLDCEIIFYGDTASASSKYASAWDEDKNPTFNEVLTAATNGDGSTVNVGRIKTIFENFEEVENYMLSKNDYIFIPVINTFRRVAEDYYGGYWQGLQASGKDGDTLSSDTTHLNDNGQALWALLIAPLFDF